jgi:plastocyanin
MELQCLEHSSPEERIPAMKKFAAFLALALASLALVACGGDDNSGTTATGGGESNAESTTPGGKEGGGVANGGGSDLEFEADPSGELAYTTTSATAKSGQVNIQFTNPQPLPHDVKVEDSSGNEIGGTETIAEGSDSATVDLKPGTYTFFCSVPGHREAGMEGTLTVK